MTQIRTTASIVQVNIPAMMATDSFVYQTNFGPLYLQFTHQL